MGPLEGLTRAQGKPEWSALEQRVVQGGGCRYVGDRGCEIARTVVGGGSCAVRNFLLLCFPDTIALTYYHQPQPPDAGQQQTTVLAP